MIELIGSIDNIDQDKFVLRWILDVTAPEGFLPPNNTAPVLAKTPTGVTYNIRDDPGWRY